MRAIQHPNSGQIEHGTGTQAKEQDKIWLTLFFNQSVPDQK